jgi:anaerobic selenocysteine-containing dehydrogenase
MTETTSNGQHDDLAAAVRTVFRTCPLCEAGCGLEITVKDGSVTRIRGDQHDVFSHGFICPKGSTLKQLHDDPDRLRRPLVKRDGVHVEVDWDQAWLAVQQGLGAVIERTGRQSIALYQGNPSAHNLSAITFGRSVSQAVGTRQHYSASTVDQMPRQVASAYVFGTAVSVPVPDLDRTDYLMILGGNPYASNGSMCTAPDFPGRIEAIRARGGKLVVVDPRRSRTAQEADEWLPIKPGTDALLLMAIVNVLFEDGLADPGEHVASVLDGLDELREVARPFTPEAVATSTGLEAAVVRRIAHELANAPTSTVYGRIGTTTTEFGTTASWLIDAVNILTGNLDRPGGAMFSLPVAGGATTRGTPRTGRPFAIGRGRSRVGALPEVMGEYPVAALADEILEPGDGQVRAVITIAGNPVLSTPDSAKLDRALADLDFMVSVDMYLNETTRHADVILPPPSQLQRSHYDVLLLQFAVRNVANYSAAALPLDSGQPDEWEVLAKLAMLLQGAPLDADPADQDRAVISAMVRHGVGDEHSPVFGRDPDEILEQLEADGRRGPERILDFMIRTGPFGDAFGASPSGATLQLLIDNEHGVDFGPLQPRLPDILRTPNGRIQLAAAPLTADVARLRDVMDAADPATDADPSSMLLVGRRHLRSNNSWMHNIEVLVKGTPRCTVQIHPDDAAELGLTNGGAARITSRVGTVDAPVEITDDIRPGVVSLPHGWGHGVAGTRMRVAGERAGVNSNVLTDGSVMDPLSGTSVLNGIPVTVAAVPAG